MAIRRALLLTLLATSLVLGLAGCADDHAHDTETMHFMWAAELEAPAALDTDHTLTLTLKLHDDMSGVDGATVTCEEPWMAMMGHGSGTTPGTITEVGAGVYTISPVTFSMAGEWTVKVHAIKGDMHEHHEFMFTIE